MKTVSNNLILGDILFKNLLNEKSALIDVDALNEYIDRCLAFSFQEIMSVNMNLEKEDATKICRAIIGLALNSSKIESHNSAHIASNTTNHDNLKIDITNYAKANLSAQDNESHHLRHSLNSDMALDGKISPSIISKEDINNDHTIIYLGTEGGDIKLCGELNADSWQFWIETSEYDFENDELIVSGKNRPYFAFFEEALIALDRYPWVHLHPIFIHNDFRKTTLEHVKMRLGEDENIILQRWNDASS